MDNIKKYWFDQAIFEEAQRFRDKLFSKDIEDYQIAAISLRKKMIKMDHSYPKYHFAPPEGWMNTPDVYFYYKGLWHMFYQYCPTLPDGRTCLAFYLNAETPNAHHIIAWGHAVSEDLIHWKDMPVAIWPDSYCDQRGSLSGQTVSMPDGKPMILYNGTGEEWGQDLCLVLATPLDDMLNTWEKKVVMNFEENKELCKKASVGGESCKDASIDYVGRIWQEDDVYYLTTGRERDGHGSGFLLESKDLLHWELSSVFFETGTHLAWETPVLIPMDGKYIMMVGPTYRHNKDGIIYWVGDFDREAKKFIPYDRRPTSVDCGIFDAHVPKQLNDGRWIMFGYHRWKNTTLGNIPYWANCTVLPREMYLYGNTLCFRPMKEWDSLITETTEYGNVSLQRKVPYVIEKTTDAYKLTFTLEKGKKKKGIDISFLVKTEGDPWSVATLTIETDGTVRYKGIEEWFTKDMFDPMFETEFTIYVDGGVIEIFVKEKQGEENISRSLVMSGACIIHNGHKLDRVEITGQGILSNICLGKIECIWQ